MNTKTSRIKRAKELQANCSCRVDEPTRTIFICDYCADRSYIGERVIHVLEEDRIGRKR